MNTLREWKLAAPKSKLDLAFPTLAGTPQALTDIVRRSFQPAQVAAGVVNARGRAKYGGLHALRHFYASWCINPDNRDGLGLPPKVVQQRLGHSSIMMTMDVYGHLFAENTDAHARLTEAAGALLG